MPKCRLETRTTRVIAKRRSTVNGPLLRSLRSIRGRTRSVKDQDLEGGARGPEEHELRTSALALPPGGEQRNGPRGAEEGDFSEVDEN